MESTTALTAPWNPSMWVPEKLGVDTETISGKFSSKFFLLYPFRIRGTSSPMVSLRHVVAMPMSSGWYCLIMFPTASFKLAPPPNTAVSSVKFEHAISTGSLKWLIRYLLI